MLIVGVTRDEFVGKPGRPIIPEDERLELVKALSCVGGAFLCDDSIQALRLWEPDIFVKGHDYEMKGLLPAEKMFCREKNVEIRLTTHNPQTTTKIVERIKSKS